MFHSSCQGHQEVLFVEDTREGCGDYYQRAWRFGFVGISSLYNFFSLAVGLNGLYHTVARSLAKTMPSKLGSDCLRLVTSETELSFAITSGRTYDGKWLLHYRLKRAFRLRKLLGHFGDEDARQHKRSCGQCYDL
jgi:hypothetical protein